MLNRIFDLLKVKVNINKLKYYFDKEFYFI